MLRFVSVLSCLGLLATCATAGGGSSSNQSDARQDDLDANSEGDGGNLVDCETVPTGWSRVGTVIDPPGGLFGFGDIAIDSMARPIVILSSGMPANGLVYRLEGNAWTTLGTPFDVNDDNSGVYSPSLRAQGDELVAMFVESGGATSNGVYVQRYSDLTSDWEVMGGGDLSTTNANVVGTDMLVDGADVLVAWSQYSEGYIGRSRIHVRRFTGNAYVPLNPLIGGIAGPGASALTPALALDRLGSELVLFSESGVQHLGRNGTNTDWDHHGEVAVSGSTFGGFSPKVTIDGMGNPVMVMAEFNESEDANQAYLQRWNGSAWDTLGAYHAIAMAQSHATPHDILVDDSNRAIIAITEIEMGSVPAKLFVGRREDNGSYTTLGGANLSGGDSTQAVIAPRMVRDTCGFYIAFAEAVDAQSERSVHVFRWKD